MPILLAGSFSAGQATSGMSSLQANGSPQVPAQVKAQLTASVPQGKASGAVMQLGLLQALEMGLHNNLGIILSGYGMESARAARLRSLTDLLPNVKTQTTWTSQQVNLAAFGLNVPGIPQIVGPFHVFDARAFATEEVDLNRLSKYRASSESERAASLSAEDTRELVVLAVGDLYLQAIADGSRVETAQAQLNTATALYNQAADMKRAGTVAAIDVLRAQVEMQAEQQRLLAAQNQFSKSRLVLARAIGLPQAQQFELAEKLPYRPAPPVTLELALARAYGLRRDYRAAQALVASAEHSRRAAERERLPGVEVNANYGDLGTSPTHSHGTYTAQAGVNIPVFQGGKVRADVEAADAELRQRKAEAENLRAQIEFEIRNAMLDIETSAQQVQVAEQAVGLARDALQQSRDRFAAGVATGVEVVQAQQAVATAEENYISSLNDHNVAKLLLARAVGEGETQVRNYLKGSQ
ncbi:MAG: TolC family protein [Acidobacteria bacterium]|nr:TolC family protein [Acidobacteriota bacterium]